MMDYYIVEPEVAGGLGRRTKLDRSVHPPIVHSLHYEFEGWLGDALLETFPVFIVTEVAAETILAARLTGVEFSDLEVTKSEQFDELCHLNRLPNFVWLKPSGVIRNDDFSCANDGRLIVSERALQVLKKVGIDHASVEPLEKK